MVFFFSVGGRVRAGTMAAATVGGGRSHVAVGLPTVHFVARQLQSPDPLRADQHLQHLKVSRPLPALPCLPSFAASVINLLPRGEYVPRRGVKK